MHHPLQNLQRLFVSATILQLPKEPGSVDLNNNGSAGYAQLEKYDVIVHLTWHEQPIDLHIKDRHEAEIP